jgi:hypothetical protein
LKGWAKFMPTLRVAGGCRDFYGKAVAGSKLAADSRGFGQEKSKRGISQGKFVESQPFFGRFL